MCSFLTKLFISPITVLHSTRTVKNFINLCKHQEDIKMDAESIYLQLAMGRDPVKNWEVAIAK